MERIKQQVDQLQQQLAGLTLSQKMLTVTLVAIMVATVVWWGHYAATDETVSLFAQPLSAHDAGGVQSLLRSQGIPYEVQAGQILVPAARRDEAFAILAHHNRLPADAAIDDAIGKISSFDPRQKTDAHLLQAARDRVKRLLESHPQVRHATVELNPVYKRQIGESLLPSAAVSIKAVQGADLRHLGAVVARLVASSQSGLKPENVTVVIDGQQIEVTGAQDFLAAGSRMLSVQAEAEQYHARRVREALAIPGITVSVFVEINDTSSRRSSLEVDPRKVVTVPIEESSETQDTPASARDAEPGVVPMIGQSIAASSASGSPTSRESTQTRNAADWGRTQEETFRPAGIGKPTACSLTVPLSWLVRDWQYWNQSDQRPAPDVLLQHQSIKLGEIRKRVSLALGGLAEEMVHVSVNTDAWESASPDLAAAGDDSSISSLIRDYGREVAVGALAAVSLLLISTMVKKTAVLAPIGGGEGASMAMFGGDDLTVAGEVEGLMLAQDLDRATMHAGQVVEQVQTLVKENPDAAAALVRRWISVG